MGLVPIKETLESSVPPSVTWGHGEKMAMCEPEQVPTRHQICHGLGLDRPVSRAMRSKLLLCIRSAVCGTVLQPCGLSAWREEVFISSP